MAYYIKRKPEGGFELVRDDKPAFDKQEFLAQADEGMKQGGYIRNAMVKSGHMTGGSQAVQAQQAAKVAADLETSKLLRFIKKRLAGMSSTERKKDIMDTAKDATTNYRFFE